MKILLIIFLLIISFNDSFAQRSLDGKYAGSIYFLDGQAKVYYELSGIDGLDSSKEVMISFVYDKPVITKNKDKITAIVYHILVNCSKDKILSSAVNHFNGETLLTCSILSGEIKKEEWYYKYILPYIKEICSK